VHTVALAGLTGLVIAAYVAVVVALDRGIRHSERPLLVLSMLAAVVAALLFPRLRDRLEDVTNQIVYGVRTSPDESLRTWASRLTRAIPLDELLLQLVESMRKSMALRSAEIFTGTDGRYELAAGVPHREAAQITVGPKERTVVARAGVSGGTWLEVWLPQLADPTVTTRVAPIVHAGELLGLIVITTPLDADPLDEDDDQVLTELARQVGLALHNVQLDSALQASLEQLQRTNVELQESRLRIVSAGDAERRKLERNLHDGAQQHLVAMAVKLRMAEELVEEDPSAAVRAIEDLRGALKETISELRALAHGIFPPLLSSGGLAEALPAAAGRSTLLTTVDSSGIGRFSPEIESTVYFCCLEAMQNAAKHAGDDAEVTIWVTEGDGRLTFEVRDDGRGFDAAAVGTDGHGFLNMRDRLGAVGGSLHVESSPGKGTAIRGEIPVA
jgi:signal transduction histidine kinase